MADADGVEIVAGLALTGYFLHHHLLAPQGRALPEARARLAERLRRLTASEPLVLFGPDPNGVLSMADPVVVGEIRDVDFADALGERYLSYALSTIMARSLPDVRDGLKPVHRRILHAMNQLRMNPDSGYKKCAQVVGEVMGKYHPHGDAAIYDAMVRLAQDFAQRYPVVDGQGNFGNIDGDNAAAMRYTESRMSAVAQAMLEGIDEDAVDFRETYDGENSEPVVLPARFPNLLANGAAGIAVGMATSIPPHNVGEICAALAASDRQPALPGRGAGGADARPRFPDRRHPHRAGRQHRRRLRDRPRQFPAARALGEGAAGARPLPDRRHRDAVSGPEEPADREDRPAARRAKAAAARRYPRRVGRGHPPRLRAEDPQCRCRCADGAAVPADRAGSPHSAQPQCPRPRRRAAGDEFEGGAAGLSRPSPRRVAAAQPAPPRRGGAAHGGAARPCHRLRQSRRGDPHHPRGRRAQGRDDGALGPHRRAGRGDPQHAPARVAPARGSRDPQGVGRAGRRGRRHREAARQRPAAMDRRWRRRSPRRRRNSAATPRSAAAARRSATRRRRSTSR